MKFTVPLFKIVTLVVYIVATALIWIKPPTSNVAFMLMFITAIWFGIVIDRGSE